MWWDLASLPGSTGLFNAQAGLSGCPTSLTSCSAVTQGQSSPENTVYGSEHGAKDPSEAAEFKPGESPHCSCSQHLLVLPLGAASVPATHCPHALMIHNLCHHASEAQEQVPCPCEIPLSPGGPDQCFCSPKRGVPLLPSVCPSGLPEALLQESGGFGSHYP